MDTLQLTSYITIIALAIVFWIAEGVAPFFRGRTQRARHASANLSLAGMNLMILLPSGLFMAVILHEAKIWWPGLRGTDLPYALQTVLILLSIDLWMYIWHRINHEIDFLWRFHAVHHSDPALDVTSAWRFHIVEITFSELLRYPVLIFIGAEIQDLLLYSLIMTPIIEFHHSNISIPAALDRTLRLVIPTPLMHRIHHSVIRTEHDSNYGSMLSIWDRIFNSFKLKEDISAMPLGLIKESAPDQQTIKALLTRPFRL